MPGHTPPESCQPPPEPASHSPRMARAAATRRSSSASWPVRAWVCPVARIQTAINDASRLVDTASREPFGNAVHLAHQLDAAPRPHNALQQVAQRLPCAFDAGRHDAGSDHRRLEQAEIVLGEVEHLVQRRDLGGRVQVHAHQAQHGLVDHAEVGLDGRPRRRLLAAPAHAQVHRNIEHARSGKSMPRKKMSLHPLCVRSMRTGVASCRMGYKPWLGGVRCNSSGRTRSGWSAG